MLKKIKMCSQSLLLSLSVIATAIHLSSGRFQPAPTTVPSSSSSIAFHSSTRMHPTAGGGHVLIDPSRICRKTRNKDIMQEDDSMNLIPGKPMPSVASRPGKESRRHRRKVKGVCTKDREVIREVQRGAAIATIECQYQFRNNHWNCSALPRSIRRILSRPTREAAYVHAITAAGVTYAVTQACSKGHVQDCPCDRTPPGKLTEGNWEWGGCGDNVHIGYERSKDILDIKFQRRRSDFRSLVLLHNNEAGRLAVKSAMNVSCKCHGLSGSCTLKTCWYKIPAQFRVIGEALKEKFMDAVQVRLGNDGKSLIPSLATVDPQKLTFLDTSQPQDFCEFNNKTGSLGTQGRECNITSQGADGCERLCCGRGFIKRKVMIKHSCHCKFQWCCEVVCDQCKVMKNIYTCR